MQSKYVLQKAMLCAAVIIAMGTLLAGCGGAGDNRDYGEATLMAKDIDDGATPLVPKQTRCPVSGARIKAEYHNGSEDERVYFNNSECVSDWESNKEMYMLNLEAQKEGPWNPSEDGWPSRQYRDKEEG